MRIFSILALLFVCLNSTGLLYADSKKEEKLPEVTVVGKKEKSSLTVPSIATAWNRIGTTPGGVDIVRASDYEKGRAATMQDVLGYSAGVYVKPRFGAEESRVSIRGSGIQRTFHLRGIELLQDGVPINQADGGGDFQAIDPLALQYVEVYRGANALEYGSTTLGGAINFVSNTGYNAPFTQARFEVGSYDYLRSQISSGHVIGPVDYYVSASTMYLSGYRDHSEQDNRRIFTNAGYRFNENVETRVFVTVLDTKSKLPGNLTVSQMLAKPEQANPTNILLNQKRNFDLVRVADKTVVRWDEKRVEVMPYWVRKSLFHPIFQVIEDISNDIGANLKYVSEADFFRFKNIFTAGFNPVFGLIDDHRYRNVGGTPRNMTASNDQFAMNLDFFGEEQLYVLPDLALVGGMQYSYAVRHNNDRFLFDGDNSADFIYRGASPKAGFRYELTERNQIFMNFSRSFEPPSFGELTNLRGGGLINLSAQTASTLEAGTRGQAKRIEWDFAYYYSWVDDELLSLNDGAGNPLGTINADQTIHQGVELGTKLTLIDNILTHVEKVQKKSDSEVNIQKEITVKNPDKLFLHGIYNWSCFHFDSDPVFGNKQLPGIPENYFRAELQYEHPIGIYVGPNVEWSIPRYPVDMANTLFAKPYAILGIKGGYRTKRGISFFVEGKNLANKTYAATTGVIADARGRDSAQFLPGDGRSVVGGIEWRW